MIIILSVYVGYSSHVKHSGGKSLSYMEHNMSHAPVYITSHDSMPYPVMGTDPFFLDRRSRSRSSIYSLMRSFSRSRCSILYPILSRSRSRLRYYLYIQLIRFYFIIRYNIYVDIIGIIAYLCNINC